MTEAVVIEPATIADLPAIDAIEQVSFPVPWPIETFEGELRREWAHIDVLRVAGTIVAFNNYWIVTTELHILAIATHPEHRGHGYGYRLLDAALRRAIATGCALATLEVRRSNQAAIALYERCGFRTVHVRARYYQDNNEDALVMLRGLSAD